MLSVITTARASSARTTKSTPASVRDTRPVARGRSAVRVTCGSKSRSAMSLTTHPAARMRNVPATNAATIGQGGVPSAAIQSAARVGHSRSSVPTGRSRRISWT